MLALGEFKKFKDLPVGGKFLLDGDILLTLAFIKMGENEAKTIEQGIIANVTPEQVVQEVVEARGE